MKDYEHFELQCKNCSKCILTIVCNSLPVPFRRRIFFIYLYFELTLFYDSAISSSPRPYALNFETLSTFLSIVLEKLLFQYLIVTDLNNYVNHVHKIPSI